MPAFQIYFYATYRVYRHFIYDFTLQFSVFAVISAALRFPPASILWMGDPWGRAEPDFEHIFTISLRFIWCFCGMLTFYAFY